MMEQISWLQVCVLVFMLLILLGVLLQARRKRGEKRILNLEAGPLTDKESWMIFQWVVSHMPEGFYVVPAKRLSEVFPSLLPDQKKLLGRIVSLIDSYSVIILDAVIVDIKTGKVVAVVQRRNCHFDKKIKQVMFDAKVPLIEANLEEKMPWEALSLPA